MKISNFYLDMGPFLNFKITKLVTSEVSQHLQSEG